MCCAYRMPSTSVSFRLISMATISVGFSSPSFDSEKWLTPDRKAASAISSILLIFPTVTIAKLPNLLEMMSGWSS